MNHQLSKPFRQHDDIFANIGVTNRLTDGLFLSDLYSLDNISHNIIYTSGMRCYVVTLIVDTRDDILSKVLYFKMASAIGMSVRRLAVTQHGHVPRGKYYYFPKAYWPQKYTISRIVVNSLEYPFRSNCRYYVPRHETRDHCIDSCLIAQTKSSRNSRESTF